MSRFLQEKYQGLDVYVPGEQPQDRSYIKLNTNESPFPPPPEVVVAMGEAGADAHLYCDPLCAALRDTAAALYGLKRENVLAFNGSDEALSFAFQAWGGSGVAYPDISYGFYPVFADLHRLETREVPLKADFRLAPEDYFDLDRLIVIANPNAPTGLYLRPSEIRQILDRNPGHPVVIDEAYIAFGGESCLPLVQEYDNLLVVRTFSKSHGLAGARLGLAFGSAGLIEDLDRLRNCLNPYNVSRMAQAGGKAALELEPLYTQRCRSIARIRDDTAAALRAMGCTVTDSLANFLFVRPDKLGGEALYQGLRERGVLVRWFSRPALRDWVRVSVGSQDQMTAFLKAAKEVLGHA